MLLDVVEKGFGNICLCYDGAQQGCCYYNNSAHLQWQESPLQMVFWQISILIQNIPIRLKTQIWNSQMLRRVLAQRRVQKKWYSSNHLKRHQFSDGLSLSWVHISLIWFITFFFQFILLKEIKAEGCWSPLCESDARFLRNDFYKVTQSGWPLRQNQQMGNRNGLIGPLTTLPSSHLFLRAILLLRLIASQITQSNFVPFASDCGHFCSLTDANEQGGLVQPGWRKQPWAT